MPRPPFAVPLATQQTIHQALIRIRRGIVDESLSLVRRRRQPVEVERQSANQRSTIGLGRQRQTFAPESRKDKRIDRGSNQELIVRSNLWQRWRDNRPQRPPVLGKWIVSGNRVGPG